MRDYQTQQKKQEKTSREKANSLIYDSRLLEQALGFVKVFGLPNIPLGAKTVLDYAIHIGDLTQEQIKIAHNKYEREYAKTPTLEELFSS